VKRVQERIHQMIQNVRLFIFLLVPCLTLTGMAFSDGLLLRFSLPVSLCNVVAGSRGDVQKKNEPWSVVRTSIDPSTTTHAPFLIYVSHGHDYDDML